MKITLKNPIIIEEPNFLIFKKKIEYPYAHLSLSMSTGFSNSDGYSVAIRLVPFRITEENVIEKLEEHAITVSTLDGLNATMHGGSEQLANLTSEIVASIQKFVNV